MKDMKNIKKKNFFTFEIFILIYILLAIYNFFNDSQWLIDNALSTAFLIIIFFSKDLLLIGRREFILFNSALLLHNMGTFGFYSLSYSIFEYDNLIHLYSSCVAGFIIFNFIARRFHIRKGILRKYSTIDDNRIIIILLVIASTMMLGTIIELAEFFGYSFLGYGEGLLFVGAGDGISENYVDTMTDIIMNLIGAVIGVIIYYLFVYRRSFD